MSQAIAKTIGWIGTGIMGKSMCKHLISAGHRLLVNNRNKFKTEDLTAMGAVYCLPEQLAERSDIIFLMAGFPSDLTDILFDKNKIIDKIKPGSIIIDHATNPPNLSKYIYEECKKKQILALDAPVTGGDIGAKQGKLSIMVGGEKQVYDQVETYMQNYSSKIQFMGGPGLGQHAKMANQIAIATCMLGVVECLLYGHKQGLNLTQLLDIIGGGGAASFSLNYYGPKIIERNFNPGFIVEHFVKDLTIALDECKKANLSLPGLSLLQSFYIALQAQGGAKLGTQGLMLVLEKLNNINQP